MTKYIYRKEAFSLIELSIAMAVLAILASSIVPIGIRSVQIKAAQKTALEIIMIQEASINYYGDHHIWPEDILKLQAERYLNASWIAENPWHKAYQISQDPTLSVTTDIPLKWESLLKSRLSGSSSTTSTKDTDFVTISAPMSSLEKSDSLPVGTIIFWPNSDLPAGFLWCKGDVFNISTYVELYQVIGNAYGGDGISTFRTPDLRGKTVFGYNPGDADFGNLGQTGGSKTHSHMIDGNVDATSIRAGGNWRLDDNSGGSDYNVIDAHSHRVRIDSNIQKHLPPYLTSNFIIKY